MEVLALLAPGIRSSWVIVAALLVAACGEPMATDDFRGQPLLSVQGELSWLGLTLDSDDPIHVAIFWSPSDGTAVDLSEDPETQFRLQFPTSFELHAFVEPEERLWVGSDPHALGLVLAYQDNDGDGRFNADEDRWVGDSNTIVIFAPQPVSREASPIKAPLGKGWHTATIPLGCDVVDKAPPVTGTCDALLGARCKKDADCGDRGICLTRLNNRGRWPLREGYCTFEESVLSCPLEEGRRAPVDEMFWLQPCSQGTCMRPGYSCIDLCSSGPQHEVCLPQGATLSLEGVGCEQPLWNPDVQQSAFPSPTGSPCDADSDCTFPGWRCARELAGTQLPGGYCTPTDPFHNPATYASTDVFVYWTSRLWFKACEQDGDCRREDGFRCDPYYHACLPIIPSLLSLRDLWPQVTPQPPPPVPPVCRQVSR